jgi:formate hydrogenlyase subunit 6/NADH:ubiquinone oxidoreductase subunit I
MRVRDSDGLPELALNWQRCICCGICAQACPEDAIVLSAAAPVQVRALSTREEQQR